jgi:ribosomal protein S27AE
MPRVSVPRVAEQQALLGRRHLLPPADAAEMLGVTRQAIDKSGSRAAGQLLLWVFDPVEGPRRFRPLYVDFGPREGQFDPEAWQEYRADPAVLVAQAAGLAATDANPLAAAVEQPASSPFDEASLDVLTLLASGIVKYDRQLRAEPPAVFPYPHALQRGLDRLTARCFAQGMTPPGSVPDLLGWCNEPFDPARWPLALGDMAGPDDRLLAGPLPTVFCQQIAVSSRDVESEVEERRLMSSVIASCRRDGNQAGYVALRRLMIENPVLTQLDLLQECARPELTGMAEDIRRLYPIYPLEYVRARKVVCCDRCGNLLLPEASDRWRCGDERCARQPVRPGRSIDVADEPHWLDLPFRTFISAPGRVEVALARRMSALGLETALWPEFDAYDLRVTFPSGESWAADIKDWASPLALARHLDNDAEPFSASPPWSRAFFVVAQDRLRQRPDYLRALTRSCRALAKRPEIAVTDERGFARAVRDHLAGSAA